MTQFPRRKVVAAAALAALITVLAVPATAAPLGAWTTGPSQMTSLLNWLSSVWTGFVGTPVEDGSGITSAHEEFKGDLEPDGLSATSQILQDAEATTLRSPDGGLL